MMMLICIKQHLSNIQNSIHVKVTMSLCWKEVFLLLKATYFVGTFNDSPSGWCDSVFNLFFFFRHEFEVAFAWIVKKLSFSEIAIWGLTSLTIFYKRIVSDCQKKTSFVQITHLKFKFLTPDDIKSYY